MALIATILLALSALQIAPNMPHSSLMHRMNTRCATPLLLAKKKGGKKKGGNKSPGRRLPGQPAKK